VIALLIDAAIALVTILDRACSAVEAARLQANPPSPVEDVHVPPGPGQRNEPAPAGHPATVRNAHAEPLRWMGEEQLVGEMPDLPPAFVQLREEAVIDSWAIPRRLVRERDEAIVERDAAMVNEANFDQMRAERDEARDRA